MQKKLRETLAVAAQNAGVSDPEIEIEYPSDITHGDLSCNVAMKYAKDMGKNPKELAEEIVGILGEIDGIEKIDIAGPGFINFHFAGDYLSENIGEILKKKEEWGKNESYAKQKLLIEHSSPNLFKPFHIGHLVNNSIGESVVRLAKNAGAEVTAISYPSDVSPGIAKAVWALQDKKEFVINDLGDAYVKGVKAYEEVPEDKNAIDNINKDIYEKNPGKAFDVYNKGKEVSLNYFKYITKRLGSDIAQGDLIFESEAAQKGQEIVHKNVPSVFEESEGAVVFYGSRYGLFDNVFVNSAGFSTYLGKDIGLLEIKFSKYDFDKSITVTDIEQKQHFQLVKKAAEMIDKKWAEKSEYIQHGRLQFSGGKISSRYGNVPLVEDLIDQVKKAVLPRSLEQVKDESKADEIAEQIAVAAIKYSIMKVSTGRNIVFDFDKSLSVEGDSGPYIQYTYARAKAVVDKAAAENIQMNNDNVQKSDLARLLTRFPEIAARSAKEYEPHYVTNYVTELASTFNSWYAQEQILDGTEKAGAKVAVAAAVAQTLKNGLWLLGIKAPSRM